MATGQKQPALTAASIPFPAAKAQQAPYTDAAAVCYSKGATAAGAISSQTYQYMPSSASSSGYVMVGGGSNTVTSSGYVLVGEKAVSSQALATSKAAAPPAQMTSSAQPQLYKQAQQVLVPPQPGASPQSPPLPQATMPTCPYGTSLKTPFQFSVQAPKPYCCAPPATMPPASIPQLLPSSIPHARVPELQVRRVAFPKGGDDGELGGAKEQDLELAAVVVTVCNGSTYDDVFRRVPQQGVEGTYVATYLVAGTLAPLLAALRAGGAQAAESAGHSADFRQLLEDIRAVEPSSVVFNWECCSACSDESFGGQQETEVVLDLIGVLLQRSHMVMCSDFSLKALIKQWSTRRLGPNPFVKLGEFGGSMHLHFDAARVAECPSAQLQRAGDLCENGNAEVRAMGSTIVYTVDHGVPALTDAYSLEVLTVASGMLGVDLSHLPAERACEVSGQRGAAGHVLLRYPSGGMLLTSAGHWGELVQMDVTEERLLSTAAEQYGAAYAAGFAVQLGAAPSAAMRRECMQSLSSQVVAQSVPCTYSRKAASAPASTAPGTVA